MTTIRTIAQKFKTSDGNEFEVEAEAQSHQKFIDAEDNYRTAVQRFGYLLAETSKTKDGCPFKVTLFRDYYFLVEPWNSMPYIKTISFCGPRFHINDDHVVRLYDESNQQSRTGYSVTELYAVKVNAERALIARQESWLKERVAEVETSKAQFEV